MSELPNSGRDIHWYTSGGRELPVRTRRYRCMNTCSHRQYIHTARPISKFYRGRWSLGTKIRRRTSTLCSSHLQVLPRALVTWYLNSSKDIHTVLVPFASSTEGAGHLVPKFVEGHPHCARPISKFYRGRWSLGTKICRSTSTLHVPFPSSTEGAGHLVHKFVEGHPHCARPICKFYRGRWTSTLCSFHLQVLPRALVTWYINSSKDIHTVLVPFASSTEDAGHLVPKFVEVYPHSSSHLQVLLRSLVTWYQNSSKDIHTVLVPFASSTEGAGHLVPKFVEGHPHCARPICKFYRGRWSLGTKICRSTSTLLVPFASSTEGAGHLVPKFVEGHPHCARPICKFYRGRWTSTLCSSHLQVLPRTLVTWYQNSSKDIHTVLVPFQVLPRALVTWYINSSKDIHTVLVPFASSTEDAGHLVPKFVEVHPHSSSHLQVLLRALVTWYINSSKDIHTVLVSFASSTEDAGHLVPKSKSMSTYTVLGHFQAFLKAYT
ncbi:hypothetical protein J6590_010592 [Homalodisca vitripennis]|nr:hypothetical protein J6590_010592 [Homalodisca vitripennis]